MKTCTKCGETKPLDCFSRDSSKNDGLRTQCKDCRSAVDAANYRASRSKRLAQVAAYKEAHPDRVKRSNAESYRKNKSRRTVTYLDYYSKNRDEIKARTSAYYQRRKADLRPYYAVAGAKRRASKRNATPAWADDAVIKLVYTTRQYLTEDTGKEWHVDHIVPLQGRNVCGLHVHFNLRVIPAKDNLSKSNHFPTD